MKRSTSRWTTAMAAAALIGLPLAGYAQDPASPQTQPPKPPTQSSAPQTPQSSASSPAEHVREAKQALSSIQASTLPASARPKIAQLRTHLNKLEQEVAQGGTSTPTPPASATRGKSASTGNWGTEIAAIDKILTELIGPETGSAASTGSMTSGAAGTAGRTSPTIDDATKDKLRDVRRHITELAAAMSGSSTPKNEASAAPAAAPESPAPSSPQQPQPTPSPAASTPATPSAQPPAATPAAPTAPVDRETAKRHLSEARESLSQLAALPEAAKLQGETRTQVSQLISNFNELITTQNDWRSAYAKLDATLTALLGAEGETNAPAAANPATAPTGTTGTAGAPAAAGTTGSGGLDPAIRAKLQEFRTHLKEFEKAAGGAPAASATGSMPPSVSTQSASNPAEPTPMATPTKPTANPTPTGAPTSGTPGATGTTGTMPSSPTAGATGTTGTMSPAPANPEVQKHLDAIADILSKAKDGKLEKEQTDAIKTHVDQLRQLLKS